MNNEQRIESIEGHLAEFANTMGTQDEEITTQIGDMIGNLLHMARQHTSSTNEALEVCRSGVMHFIAERMAEEINGKDVHDDIGPDVDVEIKAEVPFCNVAFTSRTKKFDW